MMSPVCPRVQNQYTVADANRLTVKGVLSRVKVLLNL